MNKQQKEIFSILKQSGKYGMNSYEWRTKYIQLPVRINELKAMGYLITTRSLKNRSVDYLLISDIPTVTTQPIIQPQKPWEEELVRVEKNGRVFWEPKSKFGQGGLGI